MKTHPILGYRGRQYYFKAHTQVVYKALYLLTS